jgi:hypothetical protein
MEIQQSLSGVNEEIEVCTCHLRIVWSELIGGKRIDVEELGKTDSQKRISKPDRHFGCQDFTARENSSLGSERNSRRSTAPHSTTTLSFRTFCHVYHIDQCNLIPFPNTRCMVTCSVKDLILSYLHVY